jgi:hypothetical protein
LVAIGAAALALFFMGKGAIRLCAAGFLVESIPEDAPDKVHVEVHGTTTLIGLGYHILSLFFAGIAGFAFAHP